MKTKKIKLNQTFSTSKIITTKPKRNTHKKISILFIGNSYTSFYNMPHMIIDIAQNDKNNHIELEIQSVTTKGGDLKKLWKENNALNALKSKRWDYLVLQEHSLWATHKSWIMDTNAYITKFSAKAKLQGTKTVLFKTWSRKNGSYWYNDPKYSYLQNSENMYYIYNKQINKISRNTDIETINIPDYWLFTEQNHPEINLYHKDESHPSLLGSYLTALVIYKHFTGNSPLDTTYIPYSVRFRNAKTIRQIAAYGE